MATSKKIPTWLCAITCKTEFWSVLPINFSRAATARAATFILGLVVSANSLFAQYPPPAARPLPRPTYPTQSAGPGNYSSGAASTVATQTSMAVLDDTRKLGVGDIVSFRVVEDRNDPVQLMVTDSGEMEVPYIGRVKAAGRSCKAFAVAVKSALEVDYYYRATVIVALDRINDKSSGRITVSGEVTNQGPQEIPANEPMTGSKAIAGAGGLSRFANWRKIRIIRQSPGSSPTIIIFDYKAFTDGKGDDILLQPGDTVNVPQRIFNL